MEKSYLKEASFNGYNRELEKRHGIETKQIRHEVPGADCELTIFYITKTNELLVKFNVIHGSEETARAARPELIELMRNDPLVKAWRQKNARRKVA